jgi:hypothetical protein
VALPARDRRTTVAWHAGRRYRLVKVSAHRRIRDAIHCHLAGEFRQP